MSDGLGAGGWAKRVRALVLTVVVVGGIAAGGAVVPGQPGRGERAPGGPMAEVQPATVRGDRAPRGGR
mgnify:CR=1 FL=1